MTLKYCWVATRFHECACDTGSDCDGVRECIGIRVFASEALAREWVSNQFELSEWDIFCEDITGAK